jgi:hypothetical protein
MNAIHFWKPENCKYLGMSLSYTRKLKGDSFRRMFARVVSTASFAETRVMLLQFWRGSQFSGF